MSLYQSQSATEQSEKKQQRSWIDFLRELQQQSKTRRNQVPTQVNQQQQRQQPTSRQQPEQPRPTLPGVPPGYIRSDEPRHSQPQVPQSLPQNQTQTQQQQEQQQPTLQQQPRVQQPSQQREEQQQPQPERSPSEVSGIRASARINDERPLPLSDKEHVREFEVNGRRIRVYFVVPRLADARTPLERGGQILTNLAADFDSQVDTTSYLRDGEFSTWLSIRTRRPNVYSQESRRRDIADVLQEAISQYDLSRLPEGNYEIYIHGFSGLPRGNLNTIDSILSGTLYLTQISEGNQQTLQLLRIPNASQNMVLGGLRAEAQVLIDQEVREVHRQLHYSRDSIHLSQRIDRNSLVYPVDLEGEANAVANPVGERTDRQEIDLRLGRRDYGVRLSQDRSTYYTNFGDIGSRNAQPGESERNARELEYSRYGENTYARFSQDRTEQTYRDRYDYLAGPDPRTLAYGFGVESLRGSSGLTPLTQVRQGSDTRFDLIDQNFSPSEFRAQLTERLDVIRGQVINALVDLYMERVLDTRNMTKEQIDQERQRAYERFRASISDDSLIRLLSGNEDYLSRGFGANFGRINESEFYRLVPEFQGRNITAFELEERFSRTSGSNLRVIARDLNNYYYSGIRRLSGEVLGTTGLYYDIWSRGEERDLDRNIEGRLFYHRDVNSGIRRATAQYYNQGRNQEYSLVASLGQRHELAGAYVQNDQNRASVVYGIDKDKLRTQRQGIHPYMVGAMNRDVEIAGERSNTTLGFVGARVRLGNPQSLGSFYGTAVAGAGSNNSYLFSYVADQGSRGVVREATAYRFDKESGDTLRLAAITRDEKRDEQQGTYSLRERTYDAYTYGYRNPQVDYRQTGIGFTERQQTRDSEETRTRDLYVRAFNTKSNQDSSTTVSAGLFTSTYKNKPEAQDVQTQDGTSYRVSTTRGSYTGVTASATFDDSKNQSTIITVQRGERRTTTISDSQGTYSMNTDPLRASLSLTQSGGRNYLSGGVELRTNPRIHVGKEGGTTTSVNFFGLRGGTADGRRADIIGRVGIEERRVGGYSGVHAELGQLYGQSYYGFSYEFGRVTPSVSSTIGFGVNSISGFNFRFSARF